MSETFFSLENAMKRFFFVTGRTSDEFYTDGLLKLNIEQLVHIELKKVGYQRVVFFDKNNKLYTYDDESFELLSKNGENSSSSGGVHTSAIRRAGGLKNGKVGQIKRTTADSSMSDEVSAEVNEKSEWIKGEKSGITIKNIVNDRLHMGLKDDFFVSRTIEAYMDDKSIKTAIVINDPASFIKDFNNMFHSMTTKYERLGTDNGNIFVFIYPDERFKNVYEVDPYIEANEKQKANEIKLGCPSSMETKNMLLYMRAHHSVKFLIKDVDRTALALHQAMGLSGLGIKETYIRIAEYAKSEAYIDENLCYEILTTKKPLSAEEQLNSLIGMQSVKDALLRYKIKGNEVTTASGLSRIKPQPSQKLPDSQMIHFIITGNPGTGKTTVAKLIGQLFYEMGYLSSGHVVETDRQGLVAGYVGQTAIKTRNKVIEALGGVLFIDEAYSLAKSEDGDNGNDFGQEAINTLVKAMEEFKGQFSVVVAGYRNKMEAFEAANDGLASRFGDNHIHIDDYTPEEMHMILKYQAKKHGFSISEELEQELPNFCENWVSQANHTWGNGREAETLVDSMRLLWERENANNESYGERVLEKKHIPKNKQDYFKPLSEYRAEMIDSFNNMVGLSSVKAQIEKLRKRMRFKDLKEPGHYVFVGNPGTGKTTVARFMGQIMKSFGLLKSDKVIEYSAGELMSEYSSKKIKGNFELIVEKAVNGVLFIDEAYRLTENEIGNSIIGDLLTCTLNHKDDLCIVLAGYEDNIDELLDSNPGLRSRFINRIVFDNYSGSELHEILIKNLEEEGILFNEEYKENARRILCKYIPLISNEPNFGNARYLIDTFIPACKDAKNERLTKMYGENEYPQEENCLTGVDFDPNLLHFTKFEVKTVETESALSEIDKLIGFENIKEKLRELIELGETAKRENMPDLLDNLSFHWVLKGNPGTGKTTIAKLVGQVYKEIGLLPKGHTVVVKSQDLVAEHVRGTAPKTQKKIDEAMGGILFIDEAYTLKPLDRGSDFGQEAIDTILEQMTAKNGQFGVIVAGYPDDMERFINSNDGLRSRFEQEFLLPDYTADELTKIFVSMSMGKGYFPNEELVGALSTLFDVMINAKIKGWANAREAEKLLRQMITKWSKKENIRYRINENGEKERVLECIHIPDDYSEWLKQEMQKDSETILENIEKLVGFEKVKKTLRELIEQGETARRENMPDLLDNLSFHWVLKGNPGTGKTTIAKLVGQVYKEMGVLPKGHTVVVKSQDLVAEHVRGTAPKTQKKIDEAMGGILFIDEAYTLKPSDRGSDFGQEAIDTILEQMTAKNGQFGVIVAGYPDDMERFINSNDGLRSRFEQEFLLPDYTADELTKIFLSMSLNQRYYPSEELMEQMPLLFEAMIKSKIKGWANAREAEKLLRKMTTKWSQREYVRVRFNENGEKERVLETIHIPDEYMRYFHLQKAEEQKTKDLEHKKEQIENFRIDQKELCPQYEEFDYEIALSEDFAKQKEGTVFIRAFSNNGEGQGTGAVISDLGYVLTCEHVIHDSNDIMVKLTSISSELIVKWEPAEIVWFDEELDAAILKINPRENLALPIESRDYLSRSGDSIYMMGFPFGGRLSDDLNLLSPSMFFGKVASVQKKKGLDRIDVNMEAKRGCSGGPVFSEKSGAVIGILCGSQTHGGEGLVEEVNYVLPIKYVWERVITNQNDSQKGE